MTKREREREASSAVVPSEPVEFTNDDFSDDDFSDLNKRYKGEASSAAVVPKEKRENVPLEPVEITNDDDDFFYYNFVRIYYNFVRKVKINKEFRLNPPVQVPQDEDDFSDDDDFGFDRADDFSDRYPYDPYDPDPFNFSDLPPDLGKTRARTYICGPFKLQVLEIIHEYFPMIHGQLQSQFEQCKIKMTDGVQTVYGLVCLPIKALQVSSAPNGLKVIISGATVRRGILMLTPENTKVLGGKQLDEQVLKQVLKRVVDDPSHRGKTFIINDAVQACNHGKKYDDLITEFCNETSGLVVCFGEMLIDFVPTVGGVSLAEVPAFNTAPCGTANVAVGISKLGGESSFICKVGADEFGYMMADSLKQNNVDTSGMRFHSNARTTLAFVTHRANGEREILFFRNPKSDMLLDKSELDHNLIKQAKIFHYGSISLIDEPCKSAHLAALRIAKDSDCILSYDPNLRLTLWPSAEAARNGIMSIWDLADVIKISEDEITFLTGGGDPYDDDVVLNKLFHPNLKLLIVTEGSESCRYYTKDFKGKVRGVNVKPVGTTGVGDAFVSGILYKIAYDPSIFEDEEGLQKALKFAMGFDVLSKKNIAITDDDHSRPTSPLPPVLEPQTSDCPVNHHLFKLGFGLKADKVAECLRQLGDLLNGFDVPQKAKICFQKFLFSDLNSCGSGVLPHIDEKMLKTSLHGPFILQVDEIIHGCCPLQIQRCLMFKMTDGVQTVYGIELKPIEALQVCAPRGLKVEISNVEVRRGLLILVPENIKVLGGGLVKQLDEEVLKEVLKPVVDDPSHSSSTLNITDAVQASNQGKTDDLITESSNKTSGLVVCFGEMLIGFVPSMGGASPAETAAYKKAPCGTANVAVGISKLGGSSAFISKVGANECGYMLADILKKNNVDTSGMRFDSNARTTLGFITFGADCKREILFFRNPSADMLLDKSELDHNLIKKAKIFHYGSISLIDEPCKSAHLAALRIAKDSDCILSYDPNLRLTPWPSDEAARTGIMSIWDLADVIKISEDEITFLIGGGDPYDDDVVLNKLFHPNLKLLIVTEGSKGCRYYTKGFKGKVRDVNVEPVDTTGAGDAFVSGILYNIASDPSIFEDEERLREALCFAIVCGVITGTERGARGQREGQFLDYLQKMLSSNLMQYRNISCYKM